MQNLVDALMQQRFLGLQLAGDILLNEIYLAIVSNVWNLAAFVVTTAIIVAIGFRLLTNRRRKISEKRPPYDCLSAKMAWGSTDNPVDRRTEQLLADRAARRAGSAVRPSGTV